MHPTILSLTFRGYLRSTVICLFIAFDSNLHAAGHLDDNNLRNDLVYNAATGDVRLEVPDYVGTGPIVQFSLATADQFDLSDGYVMQGLDCGLVLPAVPCGDEQSVSYFDVTDNGFEGIFPLGRLLPPGLTGVGVQSFLTEASYSTVNLPALVEFDIRVVPEPTGMAGLVAGLALLASSARYVACGDRHRRPC